MAVCLNCGKGNIRGRSHTHHRGVAGGRWKKKAPKTLRVFKPNLQPITILEDNIKISIKLCTKCIKRIKKDVLEGKEPFFHLAHTAGSKVKEETPKAN